MLVDEVAERLTGPRRDVVQRRLDAFREVDVVEPPAAGAHQVMVVPRQFLRDLEACGAVGRREAGHDPTGLEDAEVAVERAL